MLVVWQRCLCPGAQTLHEDQAIWGALHGLLPGAGVPVGVTLNVYSHLWPDADDRGR